MYYSESSTERLAKRFGLRDNQSSHFRNKTTRPPGGGMRDLHADTTNTKEKEDDKKDDLSLNGLELLALEQYYLGEEDRRARELTVLEERLVSKVDSLEALEARLIQALDAVHALEARLKKDLNASPGESNADH